MGHLQRDVRLGGVSLSEGAQAFNRDKFNVLMEVPRGLSTT